MFRLVPSFLRVSGRGSPCQGSEEGALLCPEGPPRQTAGVQWRAEGHSRRRAQGGRIWSHPRFDCESGDLWPAP